jgi:hypothetical protein
MKKIWLLAGLTLVSMTALAARPVTNAEINSYLHCINVQSKIQKDGPEGRVTDANAIINACLAQKQDMQKAFPDKADTIISKVENKLASKAK